MKHVKLYEEFLNEITYKEKSKVDTLISKVKEKVKDSRLLNKIADFIKMEILDPYNDFDRIGDYLKANFPEIFGKGKELEMALESWIAEGDLYDVKKTVKKGKMHKLLNVPEDKEITDVYKDPKKLAADLVNATGNKKEATGMLAFAANINPVNNIFDKALKAMPEIE